ncbi:bifunctional lysylphosphatidylglycerol flippase/synthetase MprF [Bacillus sp. DX1.1]|uniref:bifunctional lysylphosphatidylglycerol flippase/synthetase MprF n=1 Tax=unclassified Bacillus (in: firmicutes) TaxID=185979 RepID=UPI00256FFAEE|nr:MULTISPECIES: bifunctional lysylphosphatidylglycerol flippase/synthetase MprF [unclassified Bacillus (in: firmicutes)]MDM5154090.1 bifunctional lysylphosphatidylglycerol flippase/synthetase MprF [Bacillus sp. DX1.1]WJE83017.1 bifunctional lysylphosphatidylglycerol flippase/synthetase MprF [Bacillus sp. DX3.1]
MSFSWKRFLQIGKIIFPFVVLTIVFFQARKELSGISFREAIETIKNIPTGGVFLAITLGAFAVSTMFFYDFVMLRYLKADIPVQKIFRVSWIANSLNGFIGFGGLVGASIRTMLYRPHVKESGKLIKSIAWMTTAFINGLALLSFLGLIGILDTRFILHEKPWLWPVLIFFALFVPLYIGFSKIKNRKQQQVEEQQIEEKNPTILYSLVSLVEWLSAGIVMYVILLLFGIDIDFRKFLGVYVIAALAGIVSLVPGGLGSFDLVFLTGIGQYGVDTGVLLPAMLLYRLVYYILPFCLGLIFAAFEMTGAALKKIEDKPFIAPALETTGVIWTLQRDFIGKLGSWASAVLTAFAGLMVILSTILPTSINRAHALHILAPKHLIQLSFSLSLTFGILLVILSRGIYYGTKRSYYMTIISLIGAAIFNTLKGIDVEETFILLIVLAVLYMLRKRFVREKMEVSFSDGIKVFIFLLITLYLYKNLGILFAGAKEALKPDFVVRNITQVKRSALAAAFFVPTFLLIGSIIANRYRSVFPGQSVNDKRLQNFLDEHGGNVLSHLGFLGDKQFFFSSDEKALLLFSPAGKRLVVLGDPIGDPSSFRKVLQEFLTEADRFGYICVFYQIESKWMSLYHDFGYNFFKLGEEAVVDLNTFTISGKKRAGLRATFNRFEREGYTFSIHQPPFSDELYEELKEVSDAWLGRKKEKSFSLGYFDRDYMSRAPIATLSDADGKIIAFTTFMPVYQSGELSIDLMRYYPDAPGGIMDAIFIHLFQWAKENEYHSFNIGMAPLSNVGLSAQSFWSERVAAAIFNNVRYTYSFSGLRHFKEKYKPTWSGKYLAFRKNHSLPITMLAVTKLIGKRKSS